MGEFKMKAVSGILIFGLLTLVSCTSRLYTGTEYDDLYFSSSDKPAVRAGTPVTDRIPGSNQQADNYYDNIYAADTLVSDEYSDAIDYNNQSVYPIYDNGGGYNYYNDFSYTNRLNMFYGNYFNPYWRDPFYFNFGYPSFGLGMGYGFGMGGYPYNYGYPYYDYDYGDYGYGGCGYLYRRAVATGSSYWWHRYRACRY